MQIPTFNVTISTSSFRYKSPPLKQRLQSVHIPEYWQKLSLDQKTILPSHEDRLSELTTRQIDRIIDMEKIQCCLNDKKRKIKEVELNFQEGQPGKHPRVYQANFLAKINQIAIKRNIRHQKSEGFDEYYGQQIKRSRIKQKKVSHTPFKYIKKYRSDNIHHQLPHKTHIHTLTTEDEDTKSINSIQDDLDKFQEELPMKKMNLNRGKKKKVGYGMISSKRWFNGMSTYYLDSAKQQKAIQNKTLIRVPQIDIQSEMPLDTEMIHQKTTQLKHHQTQSTFQSNSVFLRSTPKSNEPMGKYKLRRVNHQSLNVK